MDLTHLYFHRFPLSLCVSLAAREFDLSALPSLTCVIILGTTDNDESRKLNIRLVPLCFTNR